MQAVYHTSVAELGVEFLDMLKKQFANAKVDIVVTEQDETEYLNSSTANKNLLEHSIREVESSILIHKSEKELGFV